MDSQPDGELCEEECEETQIEGDPPVEAPQYQPMDIDQAEIDAWTDRQPDEPSPYLGGEDDAHLDHSRSKVEVDGEVANGEKALGSEDVIIKGTSSERTRRRTSSCQSQTRRLEFGPWRNNWPMFVHSSKLCTLE